MRFLLASLVAITAVVQASPFFGLDLLPNGLKSRDLSGSKCVDFVYGATNVVLGQVCVTISGGTLTVTYPNISPGVYSDIHVAVQAIPITEPNQAKWQYNLGNKCTMSGGTASCAIPILAAWRTCGIPLFIATHASFTVNGGGQSGFGNGPCIPGSTQGNCRKSFSMTTTCTCPIVYEYEPIVTSAEYPVTVVTTTTVFCSTTPAASTTSASCDNPNAGPTETIATTTSVDLVCPSPEPTE